MASEEDITPRTLIKGLLEVSSTSKSAGLAARSRKRQSNTTSRINQLKKEETKRPRSISDLTPRTLIQGLLQNTEVEQQSPAKRGRPNPPNVQTTSSTSSTLQQSSAKRRSSRVDNVAFPEVDMTPRTLIRGLVQVAPVETPAVRARRSTPRQPVAFPQVEDAIQRSSNSTTLSPYIGETTTLATKQRSTLRKRQPISSEDFAAGVHERLSQRQEGETDERAELVGDGRGGVSERNMTGFSEEEEEEGEEEEEEEEMQEEHDVEGAVMDDDASVDRDGALVEVGEVAEDASGLSDEAGDMAKDTGDIAGDAGDLSDEAADMAEDTGDVAEEAGDLSDEAGDMAEDTGDVAEKAGDLSDEAGDMAEDTGDVAEEVGLSVEADKEAEEDGDFHNNADGVAEEAGDMSHEAGDSNQMPEENESENEQSGSVINTSPTPSAQATPLSDHSIHSSANKQAADSTWTGRESEASIPSQRVGSPGLMRRMPDSTVGDSASDGDVVTSDEQPMELSSAESVVEQQTVAMAQSSRMGDFSPLVTPRLPEGAGRPTPLLKKTPAPARQQAANRPQASASGVQKPAPTRKPPVPKKDGPCLPSSLTKSILTHFSKARLSKDALAAAEKGAEAFFKRLSNDLTAYSHHARRQTIEQGDVELLMRRQGLVQDQQSLYALIEKYLPLEYRKELIPMATAGNKVTPKPNH
ncbi:centromere protein T-like [Asterias rubens]|uniref:centromere protein T-like n=1 Tax=Asterias rubens TaxID=7604 RepID=UPI0014556A6F|nr:centromere protein T-like [Asterias rubens]